MCIVVDGPSSGGPASTWYPATYGGAVMCPGLPVWRQALVVALGGAQVRLLLLLLVCTAAWVCCLEASQWRGLWGHTAGEGGPRHERAGVVWAKMTLAHCQ